MKKYVIDLMKENLQTLEGSIVYGCDLGYTLFESANCDGSLTYSAHEARQWISEYFDEIGDVMNEIRFSFDDDFFAKLAVDMFENPERFMVVIVLEVSGHLAGRCKTVDSNWNDGLELTENAITTILSELDALDDGSGIYDD